MVLKPTASGSNDSDKFENDVKMYGTQTKADIQNVKGLFENDVKMYGAQTVLRSAVPLRSFENDVKFIFVNNKNR